MIFLFFSIYFMNSHYSPSPLGEGAGDEVKCMEKGEGDEVKKGEIVTLA